MNKFTVKKLKKEDVTKIMVVEEVYDDEGVLIRTDEWLCTVPGLEKKVVELTDKIKNLNRIKEKIERGEFDEEVELTKAGKPKRKNNDLIATDN